VKELRRFLTERGVDSSSIVEKQELVQMVSAAAQLHWCCAAVELDQQCAQDLAAQSLQI
jgi:hypothetical protein